MSNEYQNKLKSIFIDPQIVKSFDYIAKYQSYKKDEIVYKQGDTNPIIMILESGTLNQQLQSIDIGTIQTTVKCLSDCVFRTIDEQQYHMFLKAKHLFQKKIFDFLGSLPLFKGKKLYSLNFDFEDYKIGQNFNQDHDSQKQLLIIFDGEFMMRKKWNKGYIDIGQLSVGEVMNDYEFLLNIPQQFTYTCNTQIAKVLKVFDFKKVLDVNDSQLLRIVTEKYNHRIARLKRMTDFKSGNCIYQQPPEPEILPLRDIVNRVQTAQSRSRQPLPILVDEEVKKKVQIKMGTYKHQTRRRIYSQMS